MKDIIDRIRPLLEAGLRKAHGRGITIQGGSFGDDTKGVICCLVSAFTLDMADPQGHHVALTAEALAIDPENVWDIVSGFEVCSFPKDPERRCLYRLGLDLRNLANQLNTKPVMTT